MHDCEKKYFSKYGIPVIEGKYKLKRTLYGEGRKFCDAEKRFCIECSPLFIIDHPRHDGNTTIFSPYFITCDYENDGLYVWHKELLKLKELCDKAGFKLSVYTESIYHPLTTDFVIQY